MKNIYTAVSEFSRKSQKSGEIIRSARPETLTITMRQSIFSSCP